MRADGHLMLAFEGLEAPGDVLDLIADGQVPGVTLFHAANVESADQVAELTGRLRASADGWPPLLVAADQETGQLLGLGSDTTPFPGAMALGATRDPALAHRVAWAVGQEMRALGVDLNYAPVCDVASDPTNPSLGIRSFSDDPALVAEMVTATISGFHAAGILATAKHFPGKGEATVDPHHELPLLDLDLHRLETLELVPFQAAIAGHVDLVMVGHYSVPSITGHSDLPTSVSSGAIDGLLRRDLGFDGVVITDALDMGALPQGVGQVVDAVAALKAGVDLLLTTPDPTARERLRTGLDLAVSRGLLDQATSRASSGRVDALRRKVGNRPRPGREVVASADHLRLASEVARQSVTLVRNHDHILPLRTDGRLLAVMPRPSDLTPADTSSTVPPLLGGALRRHHPEVVEITTEPVPTAADIAGVRGALAEADSAVVGTINAGREQARLVDEALASGKPTVTVALRTPFDLAAYPSALTHLCTYSLLPPSMEALAEVLFGKAQARGSLPAAIPGLYPRGHRWSS